MAGEIPLSTQVGKALRYIVPVMAAPEHYYISKKAGQTKQVLVGLFKAIVWGSALALVAGGLALPFLLKTRNIQPFLKMSTRTTDAMKWSALAVGILGAGMAVVSLGAGCYHAIAKKRYVWGIVPGQGMPQRIYTEKDYEITKHEYTDIKEELGNVLFLNNKRIGQIVGFIKIQGKDCPIFKFDKSDSAPELYLVSVKPSESGDNGSSAAKYYIANKKQ